MEETKRYPLWLWAKLKHIVDTTPEIPNYVKDDFITKVGSKASATRNKFHCRYKPQELPIEVRAEQNLGNYNYSTIMDLPEEKLRPIILAIFNVMKRRWYGI
jgi:hypothetical protein